MILYDCVAASAPTEADRGRFVGSVRWVEEPAGALFGAVLVGAAAASGGVGPRTASRTVDSWSALGASTARLAFSKDQEREADRLGLLILYRAGYEPDLARSFVLTMARAEARRDRGVLDLGWLLTHPAGPERPAALDATMAWTRAPCGHFAPSVS